MIEALAGLARVRTVAWSAVVVLGLAALALGAAHAAAYYGLTFPERIGGAEIGPVTDFEKNDPGYGYGVHYRKPGWVIDVYIYDAGVKPVPDGLDSGAIKRQFEESQGEIFALGRRGDYANVAVKRSYTLRDGSGGPRFLCADYTFARKDMGDVDSFLCMTAWKGEFVKFRLTVARHAGSEREAAEFVNAWSRVLWP
jgi:hypothetical protein